MAAWRGATATTTSGVLLIVGLSGCSEVSGAPRRAQPTAPPPSVAESGAEVRAEHTSRPTAVPIRPEAPAVTSTRAWLTIPALGVENLRVDPYAGEPDDGAGTRIQDRGVAASPRGARGGVGPGEIGNLIVTGHRTSAGGPLRQLPSLRHGEHVLVRAGDNVYDYEVVDTMTISFRSETSKARQTAPVPGHPGKVATEPMITLSTCATPEDVAAGNLWKDEFGNLEHRIDKVGVLVDVRRAGRGPM